MLRFLAWAPERMVMSLLDFEMTREGADFGKKNRILNLDMLSFILFWLYVLTFDLWSLLRSATVEVFFTAMVLSVSPSVYRSVCYTCFIAVSEHVHLHMECTCFGQIYLLDPLTMLLPHSLFCLILILWSLLSFGLSLFLTFLFILLLKLFYRTKMKWLRNSTWSNFYF